MPRCYRHLTFEERCQVKIPTKSGLSKCGATLLVNMRDIEPRKEDDGFDGAFLSP